MIKKLELNGVHLKIDDKLRTYATKKIGRLDRFIPRNARESAHAEIYLKDESTKTKTKKLYTCEVVIKLPKDTITVQESTVNIFAAIDIVEAKLKNQLKKYKETHSSLGLHRRMLAKLRRNPVV